MRGPRNMRRVQARRRVFVGCEGDGERSYVTLVQRILNSLHQKVHLDPQPLQPGGGDPLDFCRRAEETIAKIERSRVPYDDKFLLIDSDKLGVSPERDAQMGTILQRIGARVIYQEPAREALILRHLQGCATRRPGSTQLAMHQLQQAWPEYEKNMSALQLATRIDLDALRRAAAVEPQLLVFFEAIELL